MTPGEALQQAKVEAMRRLPAGYSRRREWPFVALTCINCHRQKLRVATFRRDPEVFRMGFFAVMFLWFKRGLCGPCSLRYGRSMQDVRKDII